MLLTKVVNFLAGNFDPIGIVVARRGIVGLTPIQCRSQRQEFRLGRRYTLGGR